MIWIISGPTSAGKSTFIMSPRCAELTGLAPSTAVIWTAAASALDSFASTDVLFHYNILRLQELRRLKRELARSSMEDTRDGTLRGFKFDRHAAWINVATSPHPKKAIVVVVSKQTLAERMSQVRPKEWPELRGWTSNYSHDKWTGLLERVDLAALYRDWLQELRNNSISYLLVDSNTDAYPVIEEDTLDDVVNSTKGEPAEAAAARDESYSGREESVRLSQEDQLGYDGLELPSGLRTRGQDRSTTPNLIFPESLTGKSVLDVGSAHGYFCFEAEARGAARVVGVEVSEERYGHALRLKDIKGSKVEFIHRDIVLNPLDEQFDYVLLLNFLQHLPDPIRALRHFVSITKERLVIEFATRADRKLQTTLESALPQDYENYPLVGVGSGGFFFTPSAIQRILMDHDPLCEDIDILDSPMRSRTIALCHKRSPGPVVASNRQSRVVSHLEVPREKRRREDRRGGART
jgi:SAM-dependent methyltransferase